MQQQFVGEIKHLLSEVPQALWADDSVCGLMYDFLPWYDISAVSVQTLGDDAGDPAAWQYYNCVQSDCSRLADIVSSYESSQSQKLHYHGLLIEAAAALLSLDFSAYGFPQTVSEDGIGLYTPFLLQVTDMDGTFRFNYCEFVLAQRLAASTPPITTRIDN